MLSICCMSMLLHVPTMIKISSRLQESVPGTTLNPLDNTEGKTIVHCDVTISRRLLYTVTSLSVHCDVTISRRLLYTVTSLSVEDYCTL